jgi:YD repeat-containing protein
MCVTDNWGRQLNFEHDPVGLQVTSVIAPNGQRFTYDYDGPSGGCVTGNDPVKCAVKNLTKVAYPGGAEKTYWYNESAQINDGGTCLGAPSLGNGFGSLQSSLTGIVDENGARFATWKYDCLGFAVSSEHALGTEKVTLTLNPSSTTFSNSVTHYVGSPAAPATTSLYYSYMTINGVSKPQQLSGNCVECGVTNAITYDANSNVTSVKDYAGNLTCYAYDLTRNIEIARIEGLPSSATCSSVLTAPTLTAPARKITTQWHPIYRLRTSIAEPKKITSLEYDGSGNVLSRKEQATSDDSGVAGMAATIIGAPRIWTYTYYSYGQVASITGPRTDVLSRTDYTYDSQANIASVTNAAGHVTTLSNYDQDGRVGRITPPNGAIIDLSYHPRGWLKSQSVTAGGVTLTTSFDYDGVGQLKKVTLPDGSYVTNTYDDAHRLTDIGDSLGNSIHYTLDYWGNRITEQSTDANGMLSRQISRVYDTLNQLTKVTGGAQ